MPRSSARAAGRRPRPRARRPRPPPRRPHQRRRQGPLDGLPQRTRRQGPPRRPEPHDRPTSLTPVRRRAIRRAPSSISAGTPAGRWAKSPAAIGTTWNGSSGQPSGADCEPRSTRCCGSERRLPDEPHSARRTGVADGLRRRARAPARVARHAQPVLLYVSPNGRFRPPARSTPLSGTALRGNAHPRAVRGEIAGAQAEVRRHNRSRMLGKLHVLPAGPGGVVEVEAFVE